MHNILISLFSALLAGFRSRLALQTEILALRHQIIVLKRSVNRPKIRVWDRFLWIWLLRFWLEWRSTLVIVEPETVITWHRKGFRLFWTWKCRHSKSGRPGISKDVRNLIRTMSEIIPSGEPREFMANCSNSESMSLRQLSLNTWSDIPNRPCRHGAHIWKTALNSLPRLISFTVSTISFRILYVFLVLSHERRHVVHFSVTSHPTAEWTSQQLLHAFPYDSAPQYIIRDRDCIYGADVQRQLKDMGIHQVLTAPRSPWQSLYVERLIGSIRRECLDHVIVITEESLRATLRSYISYYHDSRCHLGLNKDSHNPGKSNCPIKVVSLKFRKSVGFIIATSAAQPDHPLPISCQAVSA